MTRTNLLASVAVVALLGTAQGAMAAEDVTQGTTNNADVTNNASSITTGAGHVGVGASLSIGATGAASATSVTGINQNFNGPAGGFGAVGQSSTNTGTIINTAGSLTVGAGNAGDGASASVSSTGALNSISITGIGGADNQAFAPSNIGVVTQDTNVNSGPVSNAGSISAAGLILSGYGSSASVGATGAMSSVSVSSINATTFSASTIGIISQTPINTGAVTNTSTGVTVGDLSGLGASASVSSTGAAGAVSVAAIGSAGVAGVTTGNVNQTVNNTAVIGNTGGTTTVNAVSGDGASVNTGATGSIASVSLTSIASNAAVNTVGTVTQISNNNALSTVTSRA